MDITTMIIVQVGIYCINIKKVYARDPVITPPNALPLDAIYPKNIKAIVNIMANRNLDIEFTPRPNKPTQPSIWVKAVAPEPDCKSVLGSVIVPDLFSAETFKTFHVFEVSNNPKLKVFTLYSYNLADHDPFCHPVVGGEYTNVSFIEQVNNPHEGDGEK